MKYAECELVEFVVASLKEDGWIVATEVANLHRSADIAAIDPQGQVVVIECKMTNMSQAREQLRSHKHAADRLYIATPMRRIRASTLEAIKGAGLGLYCVTEDGRLALSFDVEDRNEPWTPAREQLKERILELV